jgi:hypothetical protein
VIFWRPLTVLQEFDAMTAPSSIDPAHFLHEQLAQASPDLLRQMLTTFINTLMSAEADAVCGAAGTPASNHACPRTLLRGQVARISVTRLRKDRGGHLETWQQPGRRPRLGRVSKYSEEFRQQAAAMLVDGGCGVRDVARELDVNHETLRKWVGAPRRERAAPGRPVTGDERGRAGPAAASGCGAGKRCRRPATGKRRRGWLVDGQYS